MRKRGLILAIILILLLFVTGCSLIGFFESIGCSFLSGKTQDHCYQDAAVRLGDHDTCDDIEAASFSAAEGPAPRDKCYVRVAEQTGDATGCERIEGGMISYTKEECYYKAAITKCDNLLCLNIAESYSDYEGHTRTNCILEIENQCDTYYGEDEHGGLMDMDYEEEEQEVVVDSDPIDLSAWEDEEEEEDDPDKTCWKSGDTVYYTTFMSMLLNDEETKTKQDFCTDDKFTVHTCNDDMSVKTETFDCPFGCDGYGSACKVDEAELQGDCEDTDSNNWRTSGTVTVNGYTFSDMCKDEYMLAEAICEDGDLQFQEFDCRDFELHCYGLRCREKPTAIGRFLSFTWSSLGQLVSGPPEQRMESGGLVHAGYIITRPVEVVDVSSDTKE